ncbi:MAG TPA: glycosyltransferase family 39 protein [Acidimicrobiales bacterium]
MSTTLSSPAAPRHLARLRHAAGAPWRALAQLPATAQIVTALVVATVVARSPGLVFNGIFDRDEAYLAVTGDVVRDGGRLYVDVIDRKPPLVPMVYAAVRDLSVDMRAARLACALAVLANAVLVALLVRRLCGRTSAAVAAGVLAVLGTAWFLPADAQAANFELWGLAPATGAILAVVIARTAPRHAWRWFALAGALVAVAASVKQPYIVVALPVGWEALRAGRQRVAELGAAAVGVVAVLVSFASVVDLRDLWRWVWADNGDYLDGGISTGRALGIGLGLTVVFLCFHLPLLYGFWAAVTRRVRLDGTVLVWTVASLAVVPIGLRFFGHYYQQLVPPLAVLTGVALATAPRWAWRIVGATAAITTLVLVSLSFALRPDLTNFTALGRYVQATTDPQDRILVWGAIPDVYVSAQRLPTGVFLHHGYLTGNWASRSTALSSDVVTGAPYRDRWKLFLDALAEDPPELVIDGARQGTDWAAYPPSRYPIGAVLERCYDPAARVDGLQVWRRDHQACPTPSR